MRFLKSYVCILKSLAVAVIVCYVLQFKLESKSLEFAYVHLNEFLEFAHVELKREFINAEERIINSDSNLIDKSKSKLTRKEQVVKRL